MNKIKKEEKGITLVALVVTIIVLLILAGIAISLTIGNNGLFTRASNAANTWRRAEENEQAEMSNFENLYDNTVKDLGLENKNDGTVTFRIETDEYTVKSGTTWYEFFHELDPNNLDGWMWCKSDNSKNGMIGHFYDIHSSGAAALILGLMNEELDEETIREVAIEKAARVNDEIKAKTYYLWRDPYLTFTEPEAQVF